MLKLRTTRFRVLVVDNDEGVRTSVGALLERDGFRTRLAESGAQAVEVVRRELIHFSILDMFVWELTGLDILASLRRVQASLPAIFMSGSFTRELKERAFAEGAFSTIEKPLDTNRLRAEIARLVDSFGPGPARS